MPWNIRIARIAGIDIYIHLTFLLLVIWVVVAHYLPNRNVQEAVFGLAFVLALFGIVVLHELGHAVAASWYGVKTRDITLYPIGGVARLERIPEDPKAELVIAIAGPAVNVILAALIYVFLAEVPRLETVDDVDSFGRQFLSQMFVVNVWLVLFNMIPAFPMDGGRVLRAIMAFFMNYVTATQVAASLGQAVAFAFGIFGLINSHPMLLLIAFFVWIAAGQELTMVSMRSALAGIPVQRAMIRDFRSLAPDQTLATAADYLLSGFQEDFPVVRDGQIVGMLVRNDLFEKLRQNGESARVEEVMRSDYATAEPLETLTGALERLHESECRSMPVIHHGQLVGLLTPDNIGEFLTLRKVMRQQA